MSSGFIFSSIFEIILAAAVIVIVLNDARLVKFEEKLASRIRAKFSRRGRHMRVVSGKKNYPHCA